MILIQVRIPINIMGVELQDLFARHGFEMTDGDTPVMINIVTLIRVILNMPGILSV